VKSTGSYPRVHVDTAKVTAVGQAGGILLTETIRAAGLDRALSRLWTGGGNRWRSTTRGRSSVIWPCRWCSAVKR
jgi:RNase P subunit RPR2